MLAGVSSSPSRYCSTQWHQPFHFARLAGQAGRQVLGRGQVMLAVLRVEQPDPARVEFEQFGRLGEGSAQRTVQVHRLVESLGNGVQDGEVAGVAVSWHSVRRDDTHRQNNCQGQHWHEVRLISPWAPGDPFTQTGPVLCGPGRLPFDRAVQLLQLGLTRLHRADTVRPHHFVVLVLDNVAVPDELARRIELGAHAGDLAGVGDDRVFPAIFPSFRSARVANRTLTG